MLHPDAHQVEAEANAWARRTLGDHFSGDLEAALALRSPSWIGHCYPLAGARQLLRIWKLDQVYFLFDDACMSVEQQASTAEYCLGLADQLRGMMQPATGPDGLVFDLIREVVDGMGMGLRERTLTGMAVMLEGFAREVDRTASPTALSDWETTVEVRLQALGAACYLPWMEDTVGVDMTSHLSREPLLRRATRLAGLQNMYVNDLCSFRREHFTGEHGNLICTTMSSGATLQEAVDLVNSHAAQAERDFAALCDTVMTGPLGTELDVRTYLEALRLLISGATSWQYNTVRYHGPEFRCDPAKGGVWRLRHDRTETVEPATGDSQEPAVAADAEDPRNHIWM